MNKRICLIILEEILFTKNNQNPTPSKKFYMKKIKEGNSKTMISKRKSLNKTTKSFTK